MKKNSKYIDSLFSKSMNEGKENISFNEQDWTAMEYRLDRRDRRRRLIIWFSSLGGAATLLMLGLMLWPSADLKIAEKNETVAEKLNSNKINVPVQSGEIDQHGNSSSAVAKEKTELNISADVSKNKSAPLNIPVSKKSVNATSNNFKSTPHKTDIHTTEKKSSSPLIETISTENHVEKKETEKAEEEVVVSKTDPQSETVSNVKQKEAGSEQKDKTNETGDNSSKKPKAPVHKPKFYYGLVAAPDLSMIKSQRVRNVGYSVGLLLGYKFSNHWAAEAGVQWSSKKYYTDGKYFDKTGTSIPPSIDIIYLDGGCGMIEVPLSLLYDFSIAKQSFFASAGLTSYFMKKEEYDYAAQASGGAVYEGSKTYKNSGNYLFANTQLSIGYQHNLTSKMKLRVEPYVKVPLKNIGIGSMPITSTGVYVGVVRKFK